jgi:predicted RNase H-like HicB family nuclease
VTIPSSANPKPLIVWVREQEGCVDVEVYGHSGLYVTGESEEEAFAHLIDLIQLYWQDLDSRDEELSGPAKKLYDFLADLRLADDQGSS